jgi:SAM-dependent methyltransferase
MDAYRTHASEFAQRDASVSSPLARYFDIAFPRAGRERPRVLDVGAGSGREVAALLAAGFDAFGIEPVEELRSAAVALRPELANRMFPGELPGLRVEGLGRFDGVICSAVLQHIPHEQLFDSILRIRELVEVGGRALVSIPVLRPELTSDGRDAMGRLFNRVETDELRSLFERAGFSGLARWADEDALCRPGHRWETLLFGGRATAR